MQRQAAVHQELALMCFDMHGQARPLTLERLTTVLTAMSRVPYARVLMMCGCCRPVATSTSMFTRCAFGMSSMICVVQPRMSQRQATPCYSARKSMAAQPHNNRKPHNPHYL